MAAAVRWVARNLDIETSFSILEGRCCPNESNALAYKSHAKLIIRLITIEVGSYKEQPTKGRNRPTDFLLTAPVMVMFITLLIDDVKIRTKIETR